MGSGLQHWQREGSWVGGTQSYTEEQEPGEGERSETALGLWPGKN